MSLLRGGAPRLPGRANDDATSGGDAARIPCPSTALVGDTADPIAVAVAVAVAVGPVGLSGLQLGSGGLQEGGGLGVVVPERRGVRRPAVEVEIAQPGRSVGFHVPAELASGGDGGSVRVNGPKQLRGFARFLTG